MNQLNVYVESNQAPKTVPTIVPLAYQAMMRLQEMITAANGLVTGGTTGNAASHATLTDKKETKENIPLWQKYSLSVPEAAKYFGIGEKRLYQIIQEHRGADFILEIGDHYKLKRELFSRFLDSATCI